MPLSERYELRISLRKLLIGLLLTVIPICLAGLYAVHQSERALERTIGNQFKTVAEIVASEISRYVQNSVLDVAAIALEPAVISAVESSNRSYDGLQDAAVIAKIQKIDKEWATPATEIVAKEMLASPASRLLRRHRELDPRILRITVTDKRGATVAATHKTLDYYQADEEYWQNIYAQGRGAVSLTDILYDEATKSHYIGLGLPLTEERSNTVIGTIDTLIDVTSLLPMTNRLQMGPTARALLVKEDGTLIAGPQATLPMKLKSEEWEAVRDALGTLHGRQNGYMTAVLTGGGRHLIGFADTGLREHYPKLGWVLLLAQEQREALAPIRIVSRLVAFISLLGLVLVTLLAAYFALHRAEPITEIGDPLADKRTLRARDLGVGS